jgi:hypothetical protein
VAGQAGQACMADVAMQCTIGRIPSPSARLHARVASGKKKRAARGLTGGGEAPAALWRVEAVVLRLQQLLQLAQPPHPASMLAATPDNGDGGDFRRPWTVGKGALERADDGEQEAARRKGRGGRGRAHPCPSPLR